MDEDATDGADAGERGGDDATAGELAVVVAKARAESVIDALDAEGVYDADRSVREYGADAVSVPVTAVPETVAHRDVVRQVGDPRLRGLGDYLRQRGWTDDELAAAPASWAVLGTVILVEMGEAPRPAEVGEALLTLHSEADTVLAREGIAGDHREPEVRVIAGEGDTETVHVEHGTTYAMDLAEVMFSPGNKAERARMGEVVSAGERVVDMFAGIGYFTLPMARAGAEVSAIERNPAAFRYLLENVQRNGVTDRVHPYRADCRDVLGVAEAARSGGDGPGAAGGSDTAPGPDPGGDPADLTADRVVMGYYEAHDYLDSALGVLEPGGVVHMHEATPEALVFERPVERLRTAAAERDRSVAILDRRRVKGYSEGVAHVVVDARIE